MSDTIDQSPDGIVFAAVQQVKIRRIARAPGQADYPAAQEAFEEACRNLRRIPDDSALDVPPSDAGGA